MITKFKLFEDVKEKGDKYSEPEEGDYVICSTENFDALKYVVANNIGQIRAIYTDKQDFKTISVYYNNTPEYLTVWEHEILYWSKNKEELEPYITANNYNL